MLRRALPVLALALSYAFACTSSDSPLQPLGGRCDDDLQCAVPNVCACVGIRGTGDDGNDEITKHGTCQARGFKCNPSDGGLDAAQFLDTGARPDVGDEAASDAAPESATDAPAADVDDGASAPEADAVDDASDGADGGGD